MGTANLWGTTNSKPPGPIIMKDQSETLNQTVRSHLLHSFTSHYCKVCNFAEWNWHGLTFLHPILLCRITYWALLDMLWKYNNTLNEYKFWGCLEYSQNEGPREVWLISVHMGGTYIIIFASKTSPHRIIFLRGTTDLLHLDYIRKIAIQHHGEYKWLLCTIRWEEVWCYFLGV